MKSHADIVKCPKCGEAGSLAIQPGGTDVEFVACGACGHPLPVRNGIPNFAEEITPKTTRLPLSQKLMETRLFASMYETPIWRPLHTRISTGMTVKEQQQELIELAGGGTHDVIVDLACGTGHFSRALAEKWPAANVFGFDLSFSMLRKAVVLAEKHGHTNILFLRGSIFQLPFEDNSVNLVNCCGALHLFEDQRTIWREVSRILQPGGTFTGEAIAIEARAEKFQRYIMRRRGARFLEPELFRGELADAGLSDLEYQQRKLILTFRSVKPIA